MNISTGQGQSDWSPSLLTAQGTGAPPGDEIISATFTYGALGTCQGGDVKLAQRLAYRPGAREAVWQFLLDGGNVFRGIVDQVVEEPGALGSASLLAPHRARMDALGDAPDSSPGIQRLYGLAFTAPLPYEAKSEAIKRALEPYPNADYGIGPDQVEAMGLPEYGQAITYTIDDRALDVRCLGVNIPNYVTDAVFDPGEGWRKYTWHRYCPPYVPRVTGQATAEPPTVTSLRAMPLVFNRPMGIFSDYPQPQFDGQAHDIKFVGGIYHLQVPPNSDVSKNKRCSLTFPFRLNTIPEGLSPVVLVMLREVGGVGYGDVRVDLKGSDIGLEKGITLELPAELLERAPLMEVWFIAGYEKPADAQDVPGSFTLHPVRSTLEFEEPNVGAVQMPEGWAAPYTTEPTYEVKVRGWHVPPLRVNGLPGGLSQYAAGTTVTWNKDEAVTVITTAAWPYPGQRGGR